MSLCISGITKTIYSGETSDLIVCTSCGQWRGVPPILQATIPLPLIVHPSRDKLTSGTDHYESLGTGKTAEASSSQTAIGLGTKQHFPVVEIMASRIWGSPTQACREYRLTRETNAEDRWSVMFQARVGPGAVMGAERTSSRTRSFFVRRHHCPRRTWRRIRLRRVTPLDTPAITATEGLLDPRRYHLIGVGGPGWTLVRQRRSLNALDQVLCKSILAASCVYNKQDRCKNSPHSDLQNSSSPVAY